MHNDGVMTHNDRYRSHYHYHYMCLLNVSLSYYYMYIQNPPVPLSSLHMKQLAVGTTCMALQSGEWFNKNSPAFEISAIETHVLNMPTSTSTWHCIFCHLCYECTSHLTRFLPNLTLRVQPSINQFLSRELESLI